MIDGKVPMPEIPIGILNSPKNQNQYKRTVLL